MNHHSKVGADTPYNIICRDMAVFVTGKHGTAIVKTAVRYVGLQSAIAREEKVSQL